MGVGIASSATKILQRGIATQATAARASTVGNYLGLDNAASWRNGLSIAGGIYIPTDRSDQFAVAACRVTPTPGHSWTHPRNFFLGVNTIGRETFHIVTEGRLDSEGEGRVFGISGRLADTAIVMSGLQSDHPTLTIGDRGAVVLQRIVPDPGLPSLETQLLTAGVWGFAHDLPPVRADNSEVARQIQVALDNITRWRERIFGIDDHDFAASMWRSAGHAYQYCGVPWTAAYCFLRSAQRLIESINHTDGSSSVPLRHYSLLHQLRHDLEFALTLAAREPDLHNALEELWEWTNLELASYPSLV